MRIGISSPIDLSALLPRLDRESAARAESIPGLKAPAVDALIVGLLERGHELAIFTLDPRVKTPLRLTGDKLSVLVGRYRPHGNWRALTLFNREIQQLRDGIRHERPEVLHCHWSYEFALAGLGLGMPMCVTFRDFAPVILKMNRNFYRLMRLWMNYRVVAHRGEYLAIANSPYLQRALRRQWHLDAVMVPNPFDPRGMLEAEQLPSERRSARLIAISNGWGKLKNIHTLLTAFQLVRQRIPEAELELVGQCFVPDFPEVQQLRRRAPELLTGVQLRGFIPHAEIPACLRQAALLVHPSLEESFGNILLEAMAQGVPVIGGRASGAVPDVLEQGRCGRLCEVRDPRSIAEAIVELLSEPQRWRQLSRAGYDLVRERYLLPRIVSQTEELYRQLIKEGAGVQR